MGWVVERERIGRGKGEEGRRCKKGDMKSLAVIFGLAMSALSVRGIGNGIP